MLTHGSLFAGIGGFDLGFERAGIKTLWQVENEPYCVKVLERHWPGVKRYGDIKKIQWEDVEVPDIVSGGFPCQPVSVAGKRKGTEDERWLWPEFARCLRVLRPRYVVVENVRDLLSLGFGDVLGDLAELGYNADWDIIPAAAFGAHHLRYRTFIIAYVEGEQMGVAGQSRLDGSVGTITDINRSGREGRPRFFRPERRAELEDCDWWAVEPNVERVVYGVSHRMDQISCLGNAVVPQVAEWLARRIIEFETSRVY